MKIKLLAGLAAVALLCAQAAAAAAEIKVPEGTEFPMRLEEAISSQTAQTGDRFAITLDDDVMLADGTLLKAGYRGVGEIVDAQAKGMLGKTGKLNIRLLYVKVGDQRIRLRANKGAKGDNRTGAQVVTVLLLWPVAWNCATILGTTAWIIQNCERTFRLKAKSQSSSVASTIGPLCT